MATSAVLETRNEWPQQQSWKLERMATAVGLESRKDGHSSLVGKSKGWPHQLVWKLKGWPLQLVWKLERMATAAGLESGKGGPISWFGN